MPHFIPDQCTSQSAAERQVFELFRREAPDEWLVLHALKLDAREREMDFVVIAPEVGVVCLEVKGGQIHHDSRTNLWTSTDAQGSHHRIDDPFAQAESAARALRSTVHELANGQFGNIPVANIPVSYDVMFPTVTRLPQAMAEREGFRVWYTNPDQPLDLVAFVRSLAAHTQRRYPHTSAANFSAEQARRYAALLRADATFERNLWDMAKLTEQALERALSEQQRTVLGFIRANRTAVVQGGAGTGKTLLAVRAAREEFARGKRVLLVCHNELLGGFFEEQFAFAHQQPNTIPHGFITAGNFVTVMAALTGVQPPTKKEMSKESLAAFYNDVYTQIEQRAKAGTLHQYDVLIIDEGQDMVEIRETKDAAEATDGASKGRATAEPHSSEDKPADEGSVERMVILETLLKGGFTQGTWRFFWDPEQTIFDFAHINDERKEAMQRALEQYLGSNFTSVPLHQNCRNTRQIGDAAARVLHLPQSEYLPSSVEGLKVECRVYATDDEQVQQLHECLAALKAQGVHDWHITILSWLTYEKSIVSKLQGFVVRDLARYKTIPQNLTNIGFSTVGRYKGLENHCIIITDIQDGRFRTKPLYVAMTRAKTHLCLLVGAKRSAELVPLLAPTF